MFLSYLDGLRAESPDLAVRELGEVIAQAERRGFVNDVVEGRYLLGDLLARRGRSALARTTLELAAREAAEARNHLLELDAREALARMDAEPAPDASG